MPLVFSRWTFDAFDIAKMATMRLFTLAVLVSWLLTPKGSRLRLRRGPMDVLLLGFLGAVLASSAGSVSFITALFGKYKRYEGLFTFFNYALLYFLGVQIFRSIRDLSQLSKVIVGTAYIVAAYGLLQFLGLDPLTWSLKFEARKAFSTFGNPDLLAGYLVLVMPMALAEFLAAVDTRVKGIRFLGFLVIAGALVLTFTRGAWIGAFVGLVLLMVLARHKLRANIAGLGALAGALVVVLGAIGLVGSRAGEGLDLLERVGSMARITEGSAGTRLEIWKSGLAMIRERPFFGFGADTFGLMSERYETLRYVKITGGVEIADNAHNYLIQIGAGTGLIALGFLVAFFAYWLAVSLPSREVEDQHVSYVLIRAGVYSGAAAYLVYLLFGVSVIGSSSVFWLALGAITGTSSRALNAKVLSGRKIANIRVAGALALLTVTLLTTAYGVLNLAGDHYFAKSLSRGFPGGAAEVMRVTAVAANLYPGNSWYCNEVGSYVLALSQKSGSRDAADLAVALFRKARRLDNMEAKNTVNLAAAYEARWRISQRRRDLVQSESLYHLALRQRPPSVAGHYQLGELYWRKGRYRLAERELRKVESTVPSYRRLPFLLDDIRRRPGRSSPSLRGGDRIPLGH